MSRLNYHHLHYFYIIAKSGSIARASEILHLTPQTLSSQLSKLEQQLGYSLFDRLGNKLVLNSMGQITYSYAQEIFSLGDELVHSIKNHSSGFSYKFSIGVTDVIDKVFSFHFLKEVYSMDDSIKLICKETSFNLLLSDLATNRLDAILTDTPLPSNSPVKAFNHFLGESGYTFFSCKSVAPGLRKNFPYSLDGQPLFLAGEGADQRINLLSWFEQMDINPIVIGEFDDSALAKYFSQAGYGVFCSPSIVEQHTMKQFAVAPVGRTSEVTERFYLISPERRVKHPAVQHLIKKGKALLSGQLD
jgi:LysR family transcriptional activator of nhaA